jgi:hypothetical protein
MGLVVVSAPDCRASVRSGLPSTRQLCDCLCIQTFVIERTCASAHFIEGVLVLLSGQMAATSANCTIGHACAAQAIRADALNALAIA